MNRRMFLVGGVSTAALAAAALGMDWGGGKDSAVDAAASETVDQIWQRHVASAVPDITNSRGRVWGECGYYHV